MSVVVAGWIVCFVKIVVVVIVCVVAASKQEVGWRRLHYYCTHLYMPHIIITTTSNPSIHPSN